MHSDQSSSVSYNGEQIVNLSRRVHYIWRARTARDHVTPAD